MKCPNHLRGCDKEHLALKSEKERHENECLFKPVDSQSDQPLDFAELYKY